MKEFTDEDIKRVGLEILDKVHLFCVENGLRYTLIYGTLLGAVRHKGYIPWDDDIDIAMPREDYRKFIKGFDSEQYGVMSCDTNPLYYLPWAKAYDKRTVKKDDFFEPDGYEIGFGIDIFPYDEIESVEEFHKVKQRYKGTVVKHGLSLKKKSGKHSPKAFVANLLVPFFHGKGNKYARTIDKAIQDHFKGRPCNLYGHFDIFLVDVDYVLPKGAFDKLIPMAFEDRTYLATAFYDESLTASYGDYMTPPPEKERASTHGFKAYFK